jgi:TfoX/Sxy family transcriptional regulator of competence genes
VNRSRKKSGKSDSLFGWRKLFRAVASGLARLARSADDFHEVPPDVLENPHELTVWARKAIQLAALAKNKKRKK